jgi:hypothetical protein
MISGFHHGVNEIFNIVGFYAVHILVGPSGLLFSYQRFGTGTLSRNVSKKDFKISLYITSMKFRCWLFLRWVTAWVTVSVDTSHCLAEIVHTVWCHIPEVITVITVLTNLVRFWFCWEGAVNQEENLCDLMCQHSDCQTFSTTCITVVF